MLFLFLVFIKFVTTLNIKNKHRYFFWKRKWADDGMKSSFQINKTTSTIVTSSSTRSGSRKSSRENNFRKSPLTTYSFSTSPSNRHDYDVIKKSPPSFTTYGHHRRPVLPRYEYSVASSGRCPAPCPTAYETEASYDASSYEIMTSTTSNYVPIKKSSTRYEPPPPSCRTQSEMTSSCSSINQPLKYNRSKVRKIGITSYKKSSRHDDDVRYLTGASTETISDETSSGDITIGRSSAWICDITIKNCKQKYELRWQMSFNFSK